MSAPVVAGPEQLPDLRLWLADQWMPGRPFAITAAAMHASRSIVTAQPEQYRRAELAMLQHATLWWVAEPMVDLLLASARDVPADLHLGDLPQLPSAGLVVFAKPWWGIDADQPGRQVQVDALLWGVVQLPRLLVRDGGPTVALGICTYRRIDFDAGMHPDEMPLVLNTGGIAHAEQIEVPMDKPVHGDTGHFYTDRQGRFVGASIDDELPALARTAQRRTILRGTTWVPLGRSDWPVGDPVNQPPWRGMPDATVASMVEDRKVLAAFWTLIHQQGIASRTVREPQRQQARRGERAGVARELAKVQVVTLRKLERTDSAPGDEHAAREWSHRWLVSGHWRWQPHGPGRSLRRLTYVRPHVKGPADKPLHVPDRVNAWVR